MARRRSARQIAAAKRNLIKARAKKRKFHAKNRKKLKRSIRLKEYDRTGYATNRRSHRTWGATMSVARQASRHNKRYEKKLKKHRKRVAKATIRAKRR